MEVDGKAGDNTFIISPRKSDKRAFEFIARIKEIAAKTEMNLNQAQQWVIKKDKREIASGEELGW